MKLSLDPKFLGTAIAVSVTLFAVVLLVSAVAGTGPATVAGALVAATAVKLFDKLDYHPTEEIRFGAPLISVPWLYSATAAGLLLYGTRIGVDLLADVWDAPAKTGRCTTTFLLALVALGWGGFALGGWLIGRIFPQRALGLASLAFAVVLLEHWLDFRGLSADRAARMQSCINSVAAGPEETAGDVSDLRTWATVGLILHGFVAVTVARIASRRFRSLAAESASRES